MDEDPDALLGAGKLDGAVEHNQLEHSHERGLSHCSRREADQSTSPPANGRGAAG